MHLNKDIKDMISDALKTLECDKCPMDDTSCKNECQTYAVHIQRRNVTINDF